MSLTRQSSSIAGAAITALVAAPLSVVALTTAPAHAAPVEITIVGTNDFHGRLLPDRDIPGAAKYAGALNSIRADNPDTLFTAAGDLIGATTFESFINQDKPTIDVLNEMDLDVSAVGNHEFDQGYDDLVNRVMQPESPSNPKGGAEWQYIGANFSEPDGADLIPPTWTTDVGGVTVGFVGAVTEQLPSLVSPDGIEGIEMEDIVEATNREADALTAAGADMVVLLVHEGADTTDCAMVADDPVFGEIVTGTNANVDAIVSGHTHKAYDCSFPVAGKAAPRPVVSAGQYGAFLNRLDFTVESTTGDVAAVTQELINVNTGTFEPDPEVQAIVDQAVEDAEGPGSVVLGQIESAFRRAVQPDATPEDGPSENRGGESTLGNLVAEVQRWSTRTDERGNAQIAFMNPGGLRADLEGGEVTFREAANVQPFANTLVNLRMTGAQIKTLLEQQWQPEGASRPFLRLGTSKGFEFTQDASRPEGKRITGIYLRNEPLAMDESYSVTVNSFLAGGGDNFAVFTEATQKRDTGVTDLTAMVDYLAAKTSGGPLPVSYEQHAVGVHLPDGRKVSRGERLRLHLSSLDMTALGDIRDRMIRIKVGKRTIGKKLVDHTLLAGGFDETGTARVVAKIPAKAKIGNRFIRIFGNRTGTGVKVPIRVTR